MDHRDAEDDEVVELAEVWSGHEAGDESCEWEPTSGVADWLPEFAEFFVEAGETEKFDNKADNHDEDKIPD